jgi:REP-associated tyrosine transposase
MQRCRRYYLNGGVYFFTVVTEKRRRFLCEDWSREILRDAVIRARRNRDFKILGWCLLPDHFHCVIELPTESSDFSMIMGQIKRTYSLVAKPRLIGSVKPNSSQKKKREVGIWQRRFYEHAIRDDRDLSNHIEYIHWNPVKHGYTGHPRDWPYSTYHRYQKQGFYSGNEPEFDHKANPEIGHE